MSPLNGDSLEISEAEHAADCIEAWIWRHSEEKKGDVIVSYDDKAYVLSFRDLQLVLDDRNRLAQELKDCGSALSQAESTARAYQDDLRDARAEARYGG